MSLLWSALTSAAVSCSAAFLDQLTSSPPIPSGLPAAMADNLAHMAIGAITWAAVLVNEADIARRDLILSHLFRASPALEVLLCAAVASLVDADHFLAARSLRLEDATSLERRPFLHNSAVPMAILATCAAARQFLGAPAAVERLGALVLAGMLSHHVRDAWRRGLWVSPLPRDALPVSYRGYLLLLAALPILTGAYLVARDLGNSGGDLRATRIEHEDVVLA